MIPTAVVLPALRRQLVRLRADAAGKRAAVARHEQIAAGAGDRAPWLTESWIAERCAKLVGDATAAVDGVLTALAAALEARPLHVEGLLLLRPALT